MSTLDAAYTSRAHIEEGANMARRRFQSGSIRDNGLTWAVRWREDRVVEGKLVRIGRQEQWPKVEYPTKPLVKRALATRLAEVNSISYRPLTSSTFTEFAKKWEETVLIHKAPSTVANYHSHIHKHLIPFLGPRQLRDITPESIQQWVSASKASPKTVRNVCITLQAMWKTARAWRYVQHSVIEGVEFAPVLHSERFFFSLDETHRILAAAAEPYRTFYSLAAETGMRAGELVGLKVGDLHLDSGVLFVERSIYRGKEKGTKTAHGKRVIEMSDVLVDRLRGYLLTWRPNVEGYLFTSSSGRPWDANEVLKKKFRPLLNQLGIIVPSGTGFHGWRHAAATLLDSLNAPDKVRESRIGHANAGFTKQHYTHKVDSDARRVANQIGEQIFGSFKEVKPKCQERDQRTQNTYSAAFVN